MQFMFDWIKYLMDNVVFAPTKVQNTTPIRDLKQFLDTMVLDPALQPTYSPDGQLQRTQCNVGARRSAEYLGCLELDNLDLNADQMHDIMLTNKSQKWKQVSAEEAAAQALSNKLAFASLTSTQLGEQHGHITTIYPAPMQRSESWNDQVPMCCNIGPGDKVTHKNFIGRISQAFFVSGPRPDYFIYIS